MITKGQLDSSVSTTLSPSQSNAIDMMPINTLEMFKFLRYPYLRISQKTGNGPNGE